MHARLALLALAAFWALPPGEAAAHVKWFCGAVDLTVPPVPVRDLPERLLLSGGLAFVALILGGAALDGELARRWPRLLGRHPRSALLEETVLRIGLAGYLLCLWDNTAMVPWAAGANGAVLTPELLHQDVWIGRSQLALALLLALRRTCALAGLGLAALFAVGVARFGLFHMTDYLFFPGLAAYFVLGAGRFAGRPALQAWRIPILTASLSVSLMWTAVEKFLYPDWTATVLLVHPALAFGFPLPFVIGVAGFVEFSLAFYLLAGRALLRLDALLLIGVFVSAIPEFGDLDQVGHAPIIAILMATAIHGPSPLQDLLRARRAGPVREAGTVAGLCVASFLVLTAAYYGLQRTVGWV